MCETHVREGRIEDVRALVDEGERESLNDPDSLILWGKLRETIGDGAGAIATYLRCIELAPDSSDGWASLSLARVKLGQYDRVIDEMSGILATKPFNVHFRRIMADALEGRGDVTEAGAHRTIIHGLDDLAHRARPAVGISLRTNRHRDPFDKERPILLYSTDVSDRPIKIARAIREYGGECVVLSNEKIPEDAEGLFLDASVCQAAEESLRRARELIAEHRCQVAHLFSYSYDNLSAALLSTNLEIPCVGDAYDLVTTGYRMDGNPHFARQAVVEQVWLANVDALCTRSLEPLALRRAGYRRPKPSLIFPDYCVEDVELQPKQRKEDGFLHFVHCGTIDSGEDPDHADSVHWLMDVVEAMPAKLHIYPYGSSKETLSQTCGRLPGYAARVARSDKIFLNSPLPQKRFLETISAFDVGLHGTSWYNEDYETRTFRIASKSYLSFANKITSYLDAGVLPTVHPNNRFCARLLKSAGLDSVLTESQARSVGFWQETGRKLRAGEFALDRVRSKLSIRSHAGRLESFYKSILNA